MKGLNIAVHFFIGTPLHVFEFKKNSTIAFNVEMLNFVLSDQIWTLPGQNRGRPPGSRPFPLCHLRRLRQVQERTPQQKAPGT